MYRHTTNNSALLLFSVAAIFSVAKARERDAVNETTETIPWQTLPINIIRNDIGTDNRHYKYLKSYDR